MNKGKSEYLNIRTVSAVKAYYPPPDLTEDKIVDLATIMERDMKRLERDDSSSQADNRASHSAYISHQYTTRAICPR